MCARERVMRAVCHREEETYPIVYRAEVWFFRIRARGSDFTCVRDDELPVVSICLTAMFSDMFEANGLSITPAYGASCVTSAETAYPRKVVRLLGAGYAQEGGR